MRTMRLIYLSFVMVLSMLILPLAASAQGNAGGNSEAAAACAHGGYLSYTDAAGNAFKNVGQCVSYAAQGGTLADVVVASLTIVDGKTDFDGSIVGTGFTPGATLTSVGLSGDGGYSGLHALTGTLVDMDGSLITSPAVYWCSYYWYWLEWPSAMLTVTDSEGFMVRQTVDLESYCST